MTAAVGPTVAVVGAGIAGLAAAWELIGGREDAADQTATGNDPRPRVIVLEASSRIGGKLASIEFAGRTVDLAADAFLARRPEATTLVEELGQSAALVPVGASGASIWARGRLRPMPDGLNLGVPTRWWPLFRSGILTPGEAVAVTRDLIRPHRHATSITGDRSVADVIRPRMGRPVVERLVDPLVGGIHAGSADELSAAATFPVLLAADRQSGSLMRALGRARPPASDPATPVFWSLSGGTASLATRLADQLERRGVRIYPGVTVDAMTASDHGLGRRHGWRLSLGGKGEREDLRRAGDGPEVVAGDGPDGADALEVDGVVLALPARQAAVLLAPHAPEVAGLLSAIEYASVTVVTVSVPTAQIGAPLVGTGFLVPRSSTIDGRRPLITGCTYLSRKWPHLAAPGHELIRLSVGRHGDDRQASLDDDELTARVLAELYTVLEVHGRPGGSVVTRWVDAFPQYPVDHLLRVARITDGVAALPGVAVAGAALRGVGIPACIGSGRAAAVAVLASLAP